MWASQRQRHSLDLSHRWGLWVLWSLESYSVQVKLNQSVGIASPVGWVWRCLDHRGWVWRCLEHNLPVDGVAPFPVNQHIGCALRVCCPSPCPHPALQPPSLFDRCLTRPCLSRTSVSCTASCASCCRGRDCLSSRTQVGSVGGRLDTQGPECPSNCCVGSVGGYLSV
jgi:hypothetical protein